MSASPWPPDRILTLLPELRTWTVHPGADDLAVLPSGPGVVLFIGAHGTPVLLASTQQVRRFVQARLGPEAAPAKKRADIRDVVRGVRWRPVSCAFEGRWWYYRLARELHPQDYRKRVAFAPAWFLHVDWSARVPDISVTERIWCEPGEFVGAWPTQRAARAALEALWDLFDLCRYPQQVRRAPHGTRCAYAEMGRCDAPCDGAAPLSAYVERCQAAWQLASANATTWLETAERRMREAAATQRFELAAVLRRQIEVARRWGPQGMPRLTSTDAAGWILAFPASKQQAWKLCLFRCGDIVDGPVLRHRNMGQAAEEWLRVGQNAATEEMAPDVRMEQTWLLCHELWRTADQAFIVVNLGAPQSTSALAHLLQTQADALRAGRMRAGGERKPASLKPGGPGGTGADASQASQKNDDGAGSSPLSED